MAALFRRLHLTVAVQPFFCLQAAGIDRLARDAGQAAIMSAAGFHRHEGQRRVQRRVDRARDRASAACGGPTSNGHLALGRVRLWHNAPPVRPGVPRRTSSCSLVSSRATAAARGAQHLRPWPPGFRPAAGPIRKRSGWRARLSILPARVARSPALRRQKAREQEAVRRQARQHQPGQRRRGAGHGMHRQCLPRSPRAPA